jgi:hypothetical protein
MAFASGYQITVLRNGSAVKAKSGSVTRTAGKIGKSWSIELAEPMNLSADDTWTIRRELAGTTETLITDALATGLGGSDGVSGKTLSMTRRVSGEGDSETSPLLDYCVPKTYCFVSWSWVLSLWPDAMIRNGALVHGSVYSDGIRIFHPRLPGKEFQEGDYEVIAGCDTHHACAQYLASLVGFDIEIGIPDIPLVDSFTVPSGTTWYAGIKKNLDIWQPTYEVIDGTIYVHDICVDEPVASGNIDLTTAAIANVSLNKRRAKADPPLDHLIITGRRTQNSEALLDQDPDFTPTTLSAIDLTVDLEISTSHSFTDLDQYKSWGSYSGSYGDPDDPITKKALKTQSTTMGFHVDETKGKPEYIPVTETIHTYNSDDTEVAKTVITHYYAKGFKPIRTVEDEYVYCHLPGSATKELRKVRTKTTVQDTFIKPLNLTLTRELVEGYILYDLLTKGETEYKDSPRPFADELQIDTNEDAIDEDPNTEQRVLEDTIHQRMTQIGRTHGEILIKRDLDYNKLTAFVKNQSQILQNPKHNDGQIRSDDIYRKEYHPAGSGLSINGLTCYHAPNTISHPDITNDTIADAIAERAFYRKDADQNDEYTVEIPVPFWVDMIGCMVTLPSNPVYVNGSTVTVSGGDYVLRQISERFSFEGVKAEGRTQLVVREKY